MLRRMVAPACATATGSGCRPSSGSSMHTWPRWCNNAAVSRCPSFVSREAELWRHRDGERRRRVPRDRRGTRPPNSGAAPSARMVWS